MKRHRKSVVAAVLVAAVAAVAAIAASRSSASGGGHEQRSHSGPIVIGHRGASGYRRENSFLPEDFRQGNPASPLYLAAAGNLPGEIELFYELGVDGVFSDNPDIAVAVRSRRPAEVLLQAVPAATSPPAREVTAGGRDSPTPLAARRSERPRPLEQAAVSLR